MPLYEYCCKSCGKKIEVIQKFSDDPLTVCEECGGKLEKLMSAPAIRFKGSGWYVNDYAGKKSGGDKNATNRKAAPSTEKSEKPAKAEGSSEKKSSGNKPKVA